MTAALASLGLTALTTAPPSLEQLFVEQYGRSSAGAGASS